MLRSSNTIGELRWEVEPTTTTRLLNDGVDDDSSGVLQQLEQQEMSDVIRAELHVQPVLRLPAEGHDACVAYQHVQLLALGEERSCALPDAVERLEVELQHLYLALGLLPVRLYFRLHLLTLGYVAHRQVQLCAGVIESARCLNADAGRGASDQYDHVRQLARQSLTLHDLSGSVVALVVLGKLGVADDICQRGESGRTRGHGRDSTESRVFS